MSFVDEPSNINCSCCQIAWKHLENQTQLEHQVCHSSVLFLCLLLLASNCRYDVFFVSLYLFLFILTDRMVMIPGYATFFYLLFSCSELSLQLLTGNNCRNFQ
ncbi:hypothetical protein Droror1_Dr00017479 [Drosera rotundifolia]